MAQQQPERFVGMAYHCAAFEQGAMVTVSTSAMAVKPSNYPDGTIDRVGHTDPGQFEAVWGDPASELGEADLSLELRWADDDHSALAATARTRFIRDHAGAGYKLSFALVADSLSSPEWLQANNFAGGDPEQYARDFCGTVEQWRQFTDGANLVAGLTFNHIVAFYRDPSGIDGSLPGDIEAGRGVNIVKFVDGMVRKLLIR